MAMTGPGLGAVIYSNIVADAGIPANPTQLQNYCNDLGNAIVSYIQSDAVANVTGTGTDSHGDTITLNSTGTVS